jgi:hypothetical protein
MKNFNEFIKEEVDLRGNKGIPTDFMSKVDQEARASLGVRPDDERQMMTIWPELERNMRESNQLLTTGPNGERLTQQQISERASKLENLAKEVVMDQFGEIIEASSIPIELKIKLVPMGQVDQEISDIQNVSKQAKQPTEKQQEEQDKKDEENKEKEDQERTEDEKKQHAEDGEETPGTNFKSAIDKKKILNMITQGAGKSTKDIIRASDIVDEGLQEIFGETWRRILDSWVRISDLADKMDWVIPIDRKSGMMKNAPGGMAGACQVTFENNLFDTDGDILLEAKATKVTIHATGVDFPMLIHETIKGLYLYLQSSSIKKDKETAKVIKAAVSSFEDEAQDFRYGPAALYMLLNFVNKFPESNQYKRLDTRVYMILAEDKEKMISIASSSEENQDYYQSRVKITKTDDEFLEIMKSIFSVFDLQGANYVINQERFDQSLAKREIKKIIDFIVKDIEDDKAHKADLAEWEREQEESKNRREQPSEEDEESDIDALIKQTLYGKEEAEEETEVDYSKLTQRELQELIDDALDAGDYDEVKKLAQYMKEGKEIYLKEVERINEGHSFHSRRK